jgi:predicted alpha/beta-hydrolase family hydrolase
MTIHLSEAQSKIRQFDIDPASPKQESAWVLRTAGAGGSTEGMPMGLLLALTYAVTTVGGGATTYQFSYRTKQNTTLRTTLS